MFEVKYKRDLSKQIEIYNTAIGTKFENGHDFFDACLRGDIEKITITKVPILKNYLETAKGILFEISNRTDDKQLSIFDEQLPF